MTALEMVTVRFSRIGASWFAVRERRNGKITGYRYTSGAWAGPVTLKDSELTAKLPRCPQPAFPSAERIAQMEATAAARKAKAAAAVKAGKAIAARLQAGDTVRFEYDGEFWCDQAHKWISGTRTATAKAVRGGQVDFQPDDRPSASYSVFSISALDARII